MVQGIVYGQSSGGGVTKNHWWDDLTAFDAFATGVTDTTKWDIVTTSNGTVTNVSDMCRIHAYNHTFDSSDAQISLKDSLTSGKIILIGGGFYSSMRDYTPGTNFSVYYYIGNDTDGWTSVFGYTHTTNSPSTFLEESNSLTFMPSLEAIYQGSNQWNIYIGGSPYSGNPLTKANGLKTRHSLTQQTIQDNRGIGMYIQDAFIDS